MRKNLIKAHELIQTIQMNFKNPKKLRQNCSQLEDLIQYIDPDTKYHYMLLLVQINATKLRDFNTAEQICKKVIKDNRPSVQLQGKLRLSFIYALQHRYPQAMQILQKADQLAKTKPQLQLIFVNYCQRLFQYSKQSNLLNGQRCQISQKFQEAIKYYNIQFESQVLEDQIQNKYFAAQTILQLLKTFKPNTFKGIDPKKYQNYQQQLYQQKYEREDEYIMDKLQQNYLTQKNYLKKIVDLLQVRQASIKNLKTDKRANASKLSAELQQKRLLGILKITNVLNTQKDLDKSLREEFQDCLKQFKNNSIINYSMLNQFTTKQLKIANRGYEIIRVLFLKPCFQKLKNNSPIFLGVKQKAPKKNRFINQPKSNQQELFQFKPIQSQTFSQYAGDISNFTGSYMQKVNQTSQGHERRYFHFNKDQLKLGKLKLYYSKKQTQASKHDDYYDLKKYGGFMEGKHTKALQRNECKNFEQNKCFAIIYDSNKFKNFYVPDKKDYDKWIQTLKKFQRDQKNSQNQISKSKSPNPKQSQKPKENYKQKQSQFMKNTKMRKTVQFG